MSQYQTKLSKAFFDAPDRDRCDLLEAAGVPHQLAIDAVMASWTGSASKASLHAALRAAYRRRQAKTPTP